MKKVSIFFLIFFSLFFLNQNLFGKNKDTNNFIGCVNDISKNYFLNYDKIQIKKIEIDTHNYKNWVTNNIKIITSNTRFIPNNLKRYRSTQKIRENLILFVTILKYLLCICFLVNMSFYTSALLWTVFL